jgi:hypothetical protein
VPLRILAGLRAPGLALLGVAVFFGCDEVTNRAPNQPPDTFITSSAPRDSARVVHQVEVLWSGGDLDGTIDHWEYFLFAHPRAATRIDQLNIVPPAANDPGWKRIEAARVQFAALADTLRADPRGDIGRGEFDRWSTFFVRAVDNENGVDPTPDYRTFFAYTVAPRLDLVGPAVTNAVATVPRTFVVNWNGVDSIGGSLGTQAPKEVRWVLRAVSVDGGGQPIGYPAELYDLPESAWSAWTSWTAMDSIGRQAVFRNHVPVGAFQYNVFALQGRDDAGAITPKFDATSPAGNNYATFRVDGTLNVGPRFAVRARELVGMSWLFDGIGSAGFVVSSASDTLTLSWDTPITQHYGANPGDSRYGWNLTDLNDDLQWSGWGFGRMAAPRELGAMREVFYLQNRDSIGQVTTAVIEFSLARH